MKYFILGALAINSRFLYIYTLIKLHDILCYERRYKKMKGYLMEKKGQQGGLVTGLVMGIASLVIAVIIAFVIVNTLTGAGLLTVGSAAKNATTDLESNFTEGVDEVSAKLPTVLLIAAIVLIIGVLAVLVAVWQRMRLGGGSL